MTIRAALLSAACVLLLGGCTRPDAHARTATEPTPRLPPIVKLPDDFPLAAGWPDRLDSPRRDSLVLPGCEDGSDGPPNAIGTDRVVAAWSGTAHRRQLTSYDDSDEAEAHARRLVRYFRSCPVVVSRELLWRFLTSVRRGSLGDRSWRIDKVLEMEGRPAGAEVLLVVRAGRLVLVDWATYAEDHLAALAATVEDQVDELEPVVDAACALADAGC